MSQTPVPPARRTPPAGVAAGPGRRVVLHGVGGAATALALGFPRVAVIRPPAPATGPSNARTVVVRPAGPATAGVCYAASNVFGRERMAAWRAAGGTHVLLPVFWDRWQDRPGTAVRPAALAEFLGWVADARAFGLRVISEVDSGSSPDFYRDTAPRYRNQAGTGYDADGDRYRDVVFSATARRMVGDFTTAAVRALLRARALDTTDTIRVGGGPVGEVNYPSGHWATPAGDSPSWWCFSDPAQTGRDLAAGQRRSPAPGVVPLARTAPGRRATAPDQALLDWYSGSLTNQLRWSVGLLRGAGWRGRLHALHPSWGVRDSRGSADLNWRFEMAQGTHWSAQLAAYPDGQVFPWCTWANRGPEVPHPTEDGQLSPAQYLAKLARARGPMANYLVAENAAGADGAELARMFGDPGAGLPALGYRGAMWVSYDDLVANRPGGPSLRALSGYARTRRSMVLPVQAV